ncbi:hypothetical protein GGER_22160 [Serratia rubidaea]
MRLHITGAARQHNAVEARQQIRQNLRLRQRVRQGDRQTAGGQYRIQVLFLQGLRGMLLYPVATHHHADDWSVKYIAHCFPLGLFEIMNEMA